MKFIKLLMPLMACFVLSGMLSGCTGNENPYNLAADDITQMWMETLPAKSDSPKVTEDKEIIKEFVAYANGLKLRSRNEKDEDLFGMCTQIGLVFSDGTRKEFFNACDVYFSEMGSEQQYVIKGEADKTLSSIYSKMETAPLLHGIVDEIYETTNGTASFLVSVEEDSQSLVGDKTVVSVDSKRVYNSAPNQTENKQGDQIDFYVVGSIRESYPTQCTAREAKITTAADINNTAGNDTNTANRTPLPEEASSPYYVLFKHLFEDDPGLNGDLKYITVDMTNAKTKDNTDFLALMQAFCESKGVTLLEDTIDGLTEKGLVKNLSFEEGIVIEFEDVSLSDKRLVSKARKWRGGDGAIGATFTLELKDGKWEITKTEDQWIS